MDFGKLLLKLLGFAKDAAQDYIENANKESQPSSQSRPSQSYTAPKPEPVEIERTPAEWNAYFKEILLSEFPSYTIRENVKVTDLVGFVSDECQLYTTRPTQVYKAEWGQPYKLGIPYINFYTQMPNERDYVISRIHKFMG